ncbi:amino acid ABC transporter permease [Brucella pseudogrignonensis]|uniref:Polar amino acid transport system permease protein n=1 Tax=Brucella pseudogrignonensis TaxID=419475 RepID=A0ABU1MD33_9HYPH|nr:amino acid ABC transporter permease [Brucella pseudogrignonensis]MDR6433681.1 polar amino acid transport system permease protein [Brucella pseudogrignonensis]
MTSISSGKPTLQSQNSKRSFGAGAAPKDVRGWTASAVICFFLVSIGMWVTAREAYHESVTLDVQPLLASAIPGIAIICILALCWPAVHTILKTQEVRRALEADQLIEARVATAKALDYAQYTIGFSVFAAVIVAFTQFLLANDLAVSKTFLSPSLIWQSFPLILKAFWVNIYIFLIAEVCVLVWGLIVAIARLVPGKTGAPIRALAILYTDIFRGMPAIITIYLVGFGLPLSGLPILSGLSVETYAIIALTLTFGAYVAEVYRSGIEGIHWSQVAAARSLGLSYIQTMRYVIIPQAVRRIVPPLLNDFIGLQKDTALVNIIGSVDAFNQAKILSSNHFNLSPVSVVAFIFILITIPQARFVDRILERDQRRTRAA